MKKKLRQQIIAKRDALSKTAIHAKSKIIQKRILELPVWQRSRIIMTYVSFGSEVETSTIIKTALEQGKVVTVPYCVPEGRQLIASKVLNFPEDLQSSTYGILEPRPETLRPLDPELIDLVIAPGVAFDNYGNRLGYGAGYYDRFLTKLNSEAVVIALAFKEQIVSNVYPEAHDQSVHMVITDDEIIEPKEEII
ncbi:MAG: 5-formyltetrahydrofolate cyclo-ligase [Clostridia bacterium]|nr:5-formyltetrahydrofolate cyclo-ligase [Clostridia bacterium]